MMLRPPPRIAGVTKKPSVKTKTISAAPIDARGRHRQEHPPEDAQARGAEAARGQEHALVDGAHGGGEREDRERNEDMRHADDHAEFVVGELPAARR